MADTFYEDIRRWLGQTSVITNYRKIQSTRELPKYSAINTELSNRKQKSIVYLCPSINVPQGGVKVIYNQAAIINEMKGQLAASILHPYNPKFTCTWFASGAPIKKDNKFDKALDFVMIPEFWAVPHARLLHKLGIRYGIYVQGGYIISRNSGEELDDAYHNASLILAISDDTVECINMAFPECVNKVYRVHCSVNPEKFSASSKKENIISYMPRRLKAHSQLVTFFLRKMIPQHWRIESIDGLNEDEVAAILGKSKIFLSFSELEGFSLPPVEAALSGCSVIGYTGEGAKEYWDKEIFTEIYSGDIKAFVNAVLNKIGELDSSTYVENSTAIQNLANKYSTKVEKLDMQFVSNKILEILN
ncbi:hypothetical protein GALL_180000 [mine drainage metagenome]|uniref:Glycosyl transferases group 1 n=1 Tax=mine drainage metagenome TaxID=410659 RepID=A0A1J5RUN5_9ZZZZ